MNRGSRRFVAWGCVAWVSPTLVSCFLGGPKCESGEERVLAVSEEVTEEEVGALSPETSEEDCQALCERLTREQARAHDYRYDGVTQCSFEAGTLTCSANATEGGCGGGYEEPSMGGAGGMGGALD